MTVKRTGNEEFDNELNEIRELIDSGNVDYSSYEGETGVDEEGNSFVIRNGTPVVDYSIYEGEVGVDEDGNSFVIENGVPVIVGGGNG